MKKILMILVAAALLSCSETNVNEELNGSEVDIILSSCVSGSSEVLSRAPYVGVPGLSNILVARVIGDDESTFAGVPTVEGTMQFKGDLGTNFDVSGVLGDPTFTTATTVHLFSLYPSTWTYENDGVATLTFTGSEDLMVTEQVSTTKADVASGSYQKLVFKHLLTRLRVSLSASTTMLAGLSDITFIELLASSDGGTVVKNKATYTNTGTANVAFSAAGTATSMGFFVLSADGTTYSDTPLSSYTLTGNKTFVAYSMVAPVDATSGNKEEYYLKLIMANGDVKKIGIDLIATGGQPFIGNTTGYSFDVSIRFKDDNEISVDAVVEDWDEQGEWNGEIL